MTSKKRRRYGDLSARPLPTESAELIDDVFAAFTGARPAEAETESQPRESRLSESQPRKPPLAGHESRLSESRLSESQPPESRPRQSQPPDDRLNMLAALPEVKGHLEFPYQILDHLFRHLDTYEQAVYAQLYRLSWGHKSNRCLISNDRLAERANMSVSKAKMAAKSLEAKGLVRKLERPHGLNVVQGVEYEVSAPSWQAQRSQLWQSQPLESRLSHAPNKEVLKETIKSDFSQCPDCFGTGFWYPEGTAKGVKRCDHSRLKGKVS